MSTNVLRVPRLEQEPEAPPDSMCLRTYALAGLATCIADYRSVPSNVPEFRFLQQQLEACAGGISNWRNALSAYVRNAHPVDGPLLNLAADLNLSTLEILVTALAAAIETDLTTGRAVAWLQAPVGGSRPTLALLAASLGNLLCDGDTNSIDALVSGGAFESGLLGVTNEISPLAERAVCVPVQIALALRGFESSWPGTIVGMDVKDKVVLPESFRKEAGRQAAGLSTSEQRILIIRSSSTAEGKTAACEIASHLQRRALFIDVEKLPVQGSKPTPALTGIAPWMLLRKLIPVYTYELGPGERRTLPLIPGYHGPVLVFCGDEGALEFGGEAPLTWKLGIPPPEERQQLWQAVLGKDELAKKLAFEHRHGCGRIAYLGQLARHHCLIEGRNQPTIEDIVAASMASEGTGLAGLAQHLADPISDEALVMTANLREELKRLLRRCHNRDQLVSDLGASAVARYKPGVRALFVGPSGTGKTLAAGWLATQLGMPLYRVDLAAVTSKYIGETEKNLAQLLARAEHDEIILLFDEADSLFGKRTDIREANDRFANAQTNYLLQRIESFEGIAILTSNNRSRFDSAFTRRLDMIVDFPPPRPEERRALWLSHLGSRHSLMPSEINQLARAELCGGDIRNCVLAASVPARDEQRSITYTDVLPALAAEFRKLGRELPSELTISI